MMADSYARPDEQTLNNHQYRARSLTGKECGASSVPSFDKKILFHFSLG